MVEVDVADDVDDLVADVPAAFDVVFNNDYIVVIVAVDVVAIAIFVIFFVAVAVDNAEVSVVAHVEA